jgi:hypothetical protein
MAGFLKVAEDYSRSRDLPKARKPADGEPSETEPVPLADPQGTQSTRAMSSSSRLQRRFCHKVMD